MWSKKFPFDIALPSMTIRLNEDDDEGLDDDDEESVDDDDPFV